MQAPTLPPPDDDYSNPDPQSQKEISEKMRKKQEAQFGKLIRDKGWGNPTGDYDYKGYIDKHGTLPDRGKGHLDDEFKMPSHMTFSSGSKYSNEKTRGGEWSYKDKDGNPMEETEKGGVWHFKASPFNLKMHSREDLQDYLQLNEKGNVVDFPEELDELRVSTWGL